MNRRSFIGAIASVPLITHGLTDKASEVEDDILTFKEVSGKLKRVPFEKLRKGDIAVFVQPDHGPVAGRWLVTSDPKPHTLNTGKQTLLVECQDIGKNPTHS
jgi:hypothetical protein